MKIKKYLFILLAFAAIIAVCNSCNNEVQEQQEQKSIRGKKTKKLSEKKKGAIETQKITYLTTQIPLTSDEAVKFLPLYKEFQEKSEQMIEMHQKQMEYNQDEVESMSDEEAERIADFNLIASQKLLDLRNMYHNKFKAILPPKKILRLYEVEREFKKLLILSAKEKRRKKKPRK